MLARVVGGEDVIGDFATCEIEAGCMAAQAAFAALPGRKHTDQEKR